VKHNEEVDDSRRRITRLSVQRVKRKAHDRLYRWLNRGQSGNVFSDLYLDNSTTKLWLCLGGMPLTANNRTRSVGNMDVYSLES
jgi:hypothetical protein